MAGYKQSGRLLEGIDNFHLQIRAEPIISPGPDTPKRGPHSECEDQATLSVAAMAELRTLKTQRRVRRKLTTIGIQKHCLSEYSRVK